MTWHSALKGKLQNATREVDECLRHLAKMDSAEVIDGFESGYEQAKLELARTILESAITRIPKR